MGAKRKKSRGGTESAPAPFWTLPKLATLVGAFGFLLFAPTVLFGSISLDDPSYLFENPAVTRVDGLGAIWTSVEMPESATNWPLVFTTFWVEYRLWGAWPGGYHLVNAGLHGLAASLAVYALVALGYRLPVAALAAAWFAVHPLQVESVAWITERKNVLSGVFFFGCLGCYARSAFDARRRWRLAAIGAFALSLLSKSSVTPTPLLLVAIDRLLLEKRWTWTTFWRTLPFWILSALSALQTITAEKPNPRALPLEHRPFVVAQALIFYICKLIYPGEQTPFYPRWFVDPNRPEWWLPIGGVAVAAGLFLWRWKRLDPLHALAVVWYPVLLAPMLGFVPFAYHALTQVADRYVYLACVGPFLLVASLVQSFQSEDWRRLGTFIRWLALVSVLGLALRALDYLGVFYDDQTFWNHAIETSPAETNDTLANHAFMRGDFAESSARLREVVRYRPTDSYANSALGMVLFRLGKRDEGLHYLQKATSLDPRDAEAWVNLANAQYLLGEMDAAQSSFEKGIALAPTSEFSRRGSVALMRLATAKRNYAEAVRLGRAGLSRFPNDVELLAGLAALLSANPNVEQNDLSSARALLARATHRARHAESATLDSLALASAAVGDFPAACTFGETAVQRASPQLKPMLQDRLEAYRAKQSVQLP